MRRNGFGNSWDISEGVTEFIIFENRFWLFSNLNPPFRMKIPGYSVYCVVIYIPRKHWLFKSKRYDLNNIECKLLNGDSDILC